MSTQLSSSFKAHLRYQYSLTSKRNLCKQREMEDFTNDQNFERIPLCTFSRLYDSPCQVTKSNRPRKKAVRRNLKNTDMMMERENLNLAKERILINVGGVKHETYRSTLKMIPDTRLAWIAENKSSNFEGFDATKNEYFFDRHPGVFGQILNYYRTGKLHSPSEVCGPLFEEELQFWGIDEKQMEPCCWAKYTEHRDAQANLKVFEDGAIQQDDDGVPAGLPAYLTAEEITPRQKSAMASCFDSFVKKMKPGYFDTDRWKIQKRKIFTLIEDHRSSLAAKIVTSFSLFFIITSVLSVCLHSILHYQDSRNDKNLVTQLRLTVRIMDYMCFMWFTLEILVRFVVYHPSRKRFFVSVSNWIDIIAVLTYIPQFIEIALDTSSTMSEQIEMVSSLRLLRLFRFFRLSSGLEVLKHTMIASSKEIMLLLLMLMIPVTLFATIVYFCERRVPNTKFKTIPESFWWAIVTMTTVGYGDMAPKTTTGKAFGAFCASCSLLILALPVSIIGNNFSLFYSYAQARLKLPKKSHNALVGAANVLVADTNSSHSPDLDGSDEERSGSENNNLGTGDVNLSVGKRYRRDRHSLYAGGVVRTSRRTLRSRSAGVTGLSSDSEKEQRDSLTRTSNITGETEAESPTDFPNGGDEKEPQPSQSSDSNTEQKVESYVKSNGSISEKPPTGKRRTRSGGQRIHPVITLQVTEDGDNMKSNDRGHDNETFDSRLELIEKNRVRQRTPPMQETELFGSIPQLRNNLGTEKTTSAETVPKKQYKPSYVKTISMNKNDSKEPNGTLLQAMIPESGTETSYNEETSVDQSDVDYDRVSFR